MQDVCYIRGMEKQSTAEDRRRQRQAMNDLILHLHPPKVPADSLRFTYTFGLGGLSILLFFICIATGLLLMFAYTPAPDQAYRSMINLRTEIAFGQLIRNIHHWSANLLLLVAFLHMLRVFYTSAHRPPRALNWQLGLVLLFLSIAASFTGYLLPWDQLAYWAVTVVGSMINHIPFVGDTVRDMLLGGRTVGEATLRNFYVLHVMVIPLLFLVFGVYHIWRVRKDKISVPRLPAETETNRPPIKRVTTIPHLVGREVNVGLIVIALLLTWATFVDAPLGAAANPNEPPNPTKTAWYFMGLQELLLHFEPTFAVLIIPALAVAALVIVPYLADEHDYTGVWFWTATGRRVAGWSLVFGAIVTVAFVLLSESLDLATRLDTLPVWITNGVIPLLIFALPVIVFVWWLRRRGEQTRLALFTIVLSAFVTLTIIGNLFRGTGMALIWPV